MEIEFVVPNLHQNEIRMLNYPYSISNPPQIVELDTGKQTTKKHHKAYSPRLLNNKTDPISVYQIDSNKYY